MPKRVRTVRVNCASKQPQPAIDLLMEYGYVLDANGLSYPDKLCAWLEKVKIFVNVQRANATYIVTKTNKGDS